MRRVPIAVLLFLVLGCVRCGSSTPAMPAPLPNVQGHWQGSITSAADGIGTIVVDLTQSGSAVTGSVVLSQPGLPDARGTFSGTLQSTAGVVTLQYTTFYDYGDGCTGTYGGALDIGRGELSGSYAGQNCAHTFTGSLRVDKTQ